MIAKGAGLTRVSTATVAGEDGQLSLYADRGMIGWCCRFTFLLPREGQSGSHHFAVLFLNSRKAIKVFVVCRGVAQPG
jgi:hypothetical protein